LWWRADAFACRIGRQAETAVDVLGAAANLLAAVVTVAVRVVSVAVAAHRSAR
tara:strand:- start:1386 stop:1544 length:159 start_codon:yes stop_codon:yes gene_type:complete